MSFISVEDCPCPSLSGIKAFKCRSSHIGERVGWGGRYLRSVIVSGPVSLCCCWRWLLLSSGFNIPVQTGLVFVSNPKPMSEACVFYLTIQDKVIAFFSTPHSTVASMIPCFFVSIQIIKLESRSIFLLEPPRILFRSYCVIRFRLLTVIIFSTILYDSKDPGSILIDFRYFALMLKVPPLTAVHCTFPLCFQSLLPTFCYFISG